jgi:hypothetical protein
MLKKFFSVALLLVAVASGNMFASEPTTATTTTLSAPANNLESPKSPEAPKAAEVSAPASAPKAESPKAEAKVAKDGIVKRTGAAAANLVTALYNFAAKQHPVISAVSLSAISFYLLYKHSDNFHSFMTRCGCNKPKPSLYESPEVNCGCSKPRPSSEVLN